MALRAGLSQPLIQVNDEFWVVVKTTPGPGTTTGVGGYQTFYVPAGAQVVEVGYVQPNAGDPRGFVPIPMKGQSPIAIGDGPIGAKVEVGLNPGGVPVVLGPNVNGVTQPTVTAAGLARGTIAGVYADTGIFYSTDSRTAFNSYGAAATGGTPPMINNSGDTVGEWYAGNVVGSPELGVMTLWDSYQLRAFGRKGGAAPGELLPIIDPLDGRGNAPWGMACAVAGPQSGYAWSFNYANYNGTAASIPGAIEVGPWNRIKYPGSQVSKDQPGLISTVIGYAGIDASSLGAAVSSSSPLPSTVTAVRFAIGQLELGRPEYSAVKVKILGPTTAECYKMYADAFGGDAGGTDNGKDHIWRYFDPTVVSLETCALLQKTAANPLLAPGGTTSFNITFINNGSVALPNMVLTDTLPSGLSYLSSTPAASVSGSVLTWAVGTVAPGQIVTLSVNVKATTTGTLLNSVTATSNGVFVAHANETVEVGVRALLREVKTVTPGTVNPGQNVTYTMTVYNDGTGPNGVPLVVTDYLPSGFTYAGFVNATINGAAITPTVNASNPNQPTFTLSTTAIQAGKTLVINFTALIGASTPNGTYYNNVDLTFEGKRIPPIPEAPVIVGGGQLGDTVFRDWNGNGTQDAGEEGLPGVTVTLTYYGANGVAGGGDDVVTTKTTDANGNYLFTGLVAGNYQVAVPVVGSGGVPSAYTLTADPNGTPFTTTYNKTLAANETFLTADWGYKPGGTGTIGDSVFSDENNNGIEDATDPGIPNVTVALYEDTNGNGVVDSGDLLIATTSTADGTTVDGNGDPIPAGFYEFTGLDPALKYVAAVDGSDPDLTTFFDQSYQQSTPGKVAVNTIPSDGAGGFAFTTADFGFFGITPASLGDLVYLDVDKSGTPTSGDVPLPHVTVQLYLDSNGNGIADEAVFATTTTDINGNYLFSDLGPGNYIVKVLASDPDLPAGSLGTIAQFNKSLVAGQTDLTADFPYVRILDKTVNKASEVANGILTYTISPYYPGNSPLISTQVVDSVPSGTTYVNPSASPAPASQPVNGGTGNVTWNLGSTVAAVNGTGSTAGYTPTAITRSTTAEVDDTYVNKASATTWNGGGNDLITRSADANNIKAALLKFTLPAFAASDVVDRAVIRIMVKTARTSNHTVTMRRLTTAWTEGTNAATGATWNDSDGTGSAGDWTTAGVFGSSDYDGTVSYGSFSAPFTVGQTLEFDVTDLVRAWRAGTVSNNGVVLISSGTDAGDLSFYSSEASAASTPGPRLVIGYSATGSGSFTVRDQFGTAAYDNNNGTKNWAGGWIETGEKGDVGGGDIKIAGSQLVVKDGANGKSIYRSADLAGATAATLSFTLAANTMDNTGDKVKIQASITGGSSWVDLDTFSTGTATGSKTYNLITALGSVNKDTRIRFLQAGRSGTAKQIQVDDVQISYTTPVGGATSTQLAADTALLTGTRNVTVTMTVKADLSDAVTPPANLTVTATGTASASRLSGPTPATGTADSDGVTFSYVYQVSAGAGVGSVKFSGVATGSSTYASGTSQSVLTTAPLTFQVMVNSPAPSPGPIINTANLTANGGALTITSPQAITATKASIGDLVWLDTNGDGVQDPGEPGIAGVTVHVYLDANMDGVPDGAVVGTAVSDVAGHYQVNGFDAGNYLVRYDGTTAPAGYYPTTAPSQTVYGLAAGQQYVAADFGLQPPPASPASIGDTVWIDANNNGIVDSGEAGIANVNVKLYADWNNNGLVDGGDALIATTSTDANGQYSFTNLNAGHYVVQVDTTDPDFPATLALVTGGSTPTSPPANGVWQVDPSAGQNVTTADFGYNWTGRIGDYVWWDANHDGVQDPGELPIANAFVMLYVDVNSNGIIDQANGDYQVAGTFTDANGAYQFSNLPAGHYLVDVYEDSIAVVGAEPVPTTAAVIAKNLAAGEQYMAADFGYFQGAIVSGNVFWDANRDTVFETGEMGLTPVTVTLTGTDMFGVPVTATTPTDANGHFVFVVPEGNYTLSYSTPNVLAVNPSLTDVTTPVSYTFHASPGEDGASFFDFGVDNNGKIGDTIFDDANGDGAQGTGEAGLVNVTVELYQDNNNNNLVDGGDTFLDVQLTDANGKYLFVGLADGNYVVNVLRATVPSGYDAAPTAHPPTEWTSGSVAGATVSGGAAVLDRDFGYHPTLVTYTVSGNIWNDNGAGGGSAGDGIKTAGEPSFGNVTVTISVNGVPFTVTTDGSGNYSLSGVSGTAVVIITVNTATLPSAAFVNTGDPDGVKNSTTTFTMANANVGNKNFGYNQVFGSIAGTVVTGINGNGLADVGEVAHASVPVTLTFAGADGILGTGDDTISTTTTDVNGDYSFANLQPGNYAVTTTVPAGFQPYADRDGFNPNNIAVALTVGQNVVDQDFEYQAGSIGDYVWLDLNGNGVQDSGEPPLVGVRVYVDSNHNGSFDFGEPSGITNSSGFYSITALAAGTLAVRVDTSTLPTGTSPTYDPDGVGTANVASVVLAPNQNRTDVDFGYRGNATVTGHLYIDSNGNHTQDPGEPNLANVDVLVTDSLGHQQTVSTDSNGNWSVLVVAGSTIANVQESDPQYPAGYTQTEGDDPTTVIAVASSSVSAGNDGYFLPGTIGDFVWNDLNANGQQDSGEPGINGVSVNLYRPGFGPDGIPGNADDANVVATVTTASGGAYSFGGLPPGDYTVGFGAAPGLVHTPANIGADATDSDANATTGQTGTVSLTAGATNNTVDAGYYQPGTLSGRLYVDTNGNGTQDSGEPGLANVNVIVTDVNGTAQTVTTDGSGNWTATVPPGLTTVKVDASDPDYPTGYTQTEGADPSTATALSGTNTDAGKDGYFKPGSIGNLVWFDSNHNGLVDPGEPGLPDITVELYTSVQIPGVDTPLATTVTDAIGNYGFANLPPGGYVIYLPSPPAFPPGISTQQDHADDHIDNDNNGIQPVFGGPVSSPVITLSLGENDPTIDFSFTCHGTWEEWQFLNPLGGNNQPGGNPDGDSHDNLIEYAFKQPADSGAGDPFCINPSTTQPGNIDGTFTRPVGVTTNVTYYLEYSAVLGNPTVWSSIKLDNTNIVITPVSPCTETVTIPNLETLTGLGAGEGFVRIRAELDTAPPTGTDAISHTEVEGWTETTLGICCRTYNNPYLRCASFSGTVDSTNGVSGHSLHFVTSTGTVDLATLLAPGVAYYLEVIAGANEGQRFDVASASGSTVTLATDNDLCAGTPPFNTLTTVPASLAGNQVVIRRHWTLGELFPVGGFFAAGNPAVADQVQTFANGVWTTYWLYDNSGSPKWVNVGDGTMADQAGAVMAPGQGMFVLRRNTAAPILAYGEVRDNAFKRPLCAGMNLVAGGYPLSQSTTGTASRQMNLAAGFFGSRDFKTADSLYVWKADASPGASGYDTYYLLNRETAVPVQIKWVKVGDATLAPWDATKLMPGDASAFIRVQSDLHAYTIPCPWTP